MPPRTLREQLKKSPASPSLAVLQARFLFEAARAVSGTVPSVSSHLGRSCLSIARTEDRALPRGASQSLCSNCGSPALHDTPARRAVKGHRAGRRRPAERQSAKISVFPCRVCGLESVRPATAAQAPSAQASAGAVGGRAVQHKCTVPGATSTASALASTPPAEGPADIQGVTPRSKETAQVGSLDQCSCDAGSTSPAGAVALDSEALISAAPAPVSSPKRGAAPAPLLGNQVEPMQAHAGPAAISMNQLEEGGMLPGAGADDPPVTAVRENVGVLLLVACEDSRAPPEGADSKREGQRAAEELAGELAPPLVTHANQALTEQGAGHDRGVGSMGKAAPDGVNTASAEHGQDASSCASGRSRPWGRHAVIRLGVRRQRLRWTRSGRHWMRVAE